MGAQCAGGGGAAGGEPARAVRGAWLAGAAASGAALLLQALLLLRRPRCRRYDELVLCHLAAARLANCVCEYLTMTNAPGVNYVALHFFVMYTDFALVCFMFVFSKNLYDRMVVVFAGKKWRASAAAAAVWAGAAPNGALCVLLHRDAAAFTAYYRAYVSVKLAVLLLNAALVTRVLAVVRARGAPARVALVAAALVTLTSLQTLLSDLLTVFCGGYAALNDAFFVINAFQGVHILAIFAMLARNHEQHARARARASLSTSLGAHASLSTSLGARLALAADPVEGNGSPGSCKENPQVKISEV